MDTNIASLAHEDAPSRLLARLSPNGPLLLLPARPVDHLLARVFAGRLDARLASGVAPEDSRRLAARAAWLTTPRHRRQLADVWLEVLTRARRTDVVLDTRVPVARHAVLAASGHINRLVDALSSPLPVSAQDVVRVRALLSDGRSAVYTGADLSSRVAQVAAALEHRPS